MAKKIDLQSIFLREIDRTLLRHKTIKARDLVNPTTTAECEKFGTNAANSWPSVAGAICKYVAEKELQIVIKNPTFSSNFEVEIQ